MRSVPSLGNIDMFLGQDSEMQWTNDTKEKQSIRSRLA